MFKKLCEVLTKHYFRKPEMKTAQGEYCYVCRLCGKRFWSYQKPKKKWRIKNDDK